MVNGPIDESRVYRPTDENDAYAGVFGDNGAENVNKKEEKIMSFKMTQNQYTSLYGPTVGDSIRLGDTNLFAQIEKDYAVYGEEATFGGGKSIRDGMAQNPRVTRDDVNVADLVISNAVIIDYDKVVKADIGIKMVIFSP